MHAKPETGNETDKPFFDHVRRPSAQCATRQAGLDGRERKRDTDDVKHLLGSVDMWAAEIEGVVSGKSSDRIDKFVEGLVAGKYASVLLAASAELDALDSTSAPRAQALRFYMGIASLHLFEQYNRAGPCLKTEQRCTSQVKLDIDSATAEALHALLESMQKERRPPLELDGETTTPNCAHLQLLNLARLCWFEGEDELELASTETPDGHVMAHDSSERHVDSEGHDRAWQVRTFDAFPLSCWWTARYCVTHQSVLSGKSPTLKSVTETCFARLLGVDRVYSTFADDPDSGEAAKVVHRAFATQCDPAILQPALLSPDRCPSSMFGTALLELALFQMVSFNVSLARENLELSKSALGLDVALGGALGMRTKFQQKAVSQLIVQQNSPAFALRSETPEEHACEQEHQHAKLPKNVALEDSDFLGYTKLSSEQGGVDEATAHAASAQNLSGIQQCAILAEATYLQVAQASDETQREQIAALAAHLLRVGYSETGGKDQGTHSDVQQSSPLNPLVACAALLIRTEYELERSGRYMERCMLQMEVLGDFFFDVMIESGPNASCAESVCREGAARVRYIWAMQYPVRWELQKRLAMVLGRLGLVKSSIEIFSQLQMWEEVIDCYRLMGDVGKAESLIRQQIQAQGETPRLCCVLGDVTSDESWYVKGWQLSGRRYARAKRSLGRLALHKEQFRDAVAHFREALAINALYPEVWFAMGYAALAYNDFATGADAFSRVLQLTPDSGQAWNNLSRCLKELGQHREAFVAMREATKHARDSAPVWDNYLMLAMHAHDAMACVQAMAQLLVLQKKDGVRGTALAYCVQEIIDGSTSSDATVRTNTAAIAKRLLEVLGHATALVSSNPAVWESYARLYGWFGAGSTDKELEARRRQVRAMGTGDRIPWTREHNAFEDMASACIGLADVALREGTTEAIHSAVLQLSSVLQRSREHCSTEKMFEALEQAHERLRTRQHALEEAKIGDGSIS
ncbi:Tetratricopeptide repeat protein 27 [Porphyridium purpureum]|uniref:Tetratricopeptide repeat protein 27 n=1 Tax=Porphyridium purpureum TaxID=35688 RepID=A0A5J4Z3T0_PORPP|nr:Tetratricopeptide repeat protein 27 [Porphyridium purpureum]|eukprot:POR1193..scf295_1